MRKQCRAADQRLCFRYFIVQSHYFLNPKFQASSYLLFLHILVCVGPCLKPRTGFLMTWLKLCLSWSKTPKTGFLETDLIFISFSVLTPSLYFTLPTLVIMAQYLKQPSAPLQPLCCMLQSIPPPTATTNQT